LSRHESLSRLLIRVEARRNDESRNFPRVIAASASFEPYLSNSFGTLRDGMPFPEEMW